MAKFYEKFYLADIEDVYRFQRNFKARRNAAAARHGRGPRAKYTDNEGAVLAIVKTSEYAYRPRGAKWVTIID